jgi:nucleotide-binding universal stress UspA family protein
MSLYQTLLCAVDFSDHSRYALELGAQIGKHCGARLIAFHAIETLLAEAYDSPQLAADFEKELKTFVEAPSRAAGLSAVETVVQVGDPDDAILACARERKVDLIVMGTQGLGGFKKAFFGSVTEKVLRAAFVPVLAVKPIGSVPASLPTAIVAAVHLDEATAAVLEHAAAFAADFQIPLTVMHIVPAVQALPQYTDALAAAQTDRVERAKAQLRKEIARLQLPVSVQTDVRTGDVADEIAEMVKATPGVLLAIGTGGSRKLRRPGSTAYRVLNQTSAPVVAIPDKP